MQTVTGNFEHDRRWNFGAGRVRILIVEDFDAFRQLLSSKLRKVATFEVICEVADGLEGVAKAYALEPDLVLLDLGLPTMNGIEATLQIAKIASAKILIVSQESSPEFVEAAFRAGAHGYLSKSDLEPELMVGIDTVLHGRPFISKSLRG